VRTCPYFPYHCCGVYTRYATLQTKHL